MGEVVGVKDNRLAPAKAKEEKHDGADGVEVGQGVKSQAALGAGSRIAKSIRRRGVGELVDGNGDDQAKKKIKCFHRWLKYTGIW